VYFNGSREEIRLVAPLPAHGKKSHTIGELVARLLQFQSRDWEGFDPITLKQVFKAGIEPDKCFYIQNRLAILGKERIDLAIDPPPDLAIEVDKTSPTNSVDFEAIAIPELWIYRNQQLLIYEFDGEHYQERDRSLIFPDFPVEELIPEFVERAWQAGTSVAIREFEKRLQDEFQA
ncbi:MAG: Uma2 family endonuclease, partial [Microcoleus sp. SIO2G3]|nr:Uma2 family endonuclease [Microcoleus sp. SIO2G3]